jgi:abhydrolase domain-containing protein 13
LHVGGAVAIDVAADAVYGSKVLAIIVENTFTSIPDMAVELVSPSVKYLPRICYKNKVLSTQYLLTERSPSY